MDGPDRLVVCRVGFGSHALFVQDHRVGSVRRKRVHGDAEFQNARVTLPHAIVTCHV